MCEIVCDMINVRYLVWNPNLGRMSILTKNVIKVAGFLSGVCSSIIIMVKFQNNNTTGMQEFEL